jgi:hypothetical protein
MQEETTPIISPYFDELLTVQRAVRQVLDLSAYEAAIVALQYIHTRTISEGIDCISEKMEDIIQTLEKK